MPVAPELPFYDLFALDTQRLVNEGVLAEFAGFAPVPLDQARIDALRHYEASSNKELKGLYILHYRGDSAYVGKTEGLLSERLAEHAWKIGARLNISVNEISFRCLYLDQNWSALAHEGPVIKALRCKWNQTGFGNHDPGRERDTTKLKANHFDRLFPVNADQPISISVGTHTVWAALSFLKTHCPYLVRFEGTKGAKPKGSHSEYMDKSITTTTGETVKTLIGKIADALGSNWQATFLFGYLILYKESKDYSPHSCFLMKRGGSPWITVP